MYQISVECNVTNTLMCTIVLLCHVSFYVGTSVVVTYLLQLYNIVEVITMYDCN